MWLLPDCHARREWISSLCLLLEVQHLAKDPSHTTIVQLWEALPRHLTFSSNRICFWAQALPLVSARVTLQGCCVYPHTALTLADLATCVFPGPASWPELVWQTQVPQSPLSHWYPHLDLGCPPWSAASATPVMSAMVLLPWRQNSLPLLLPGMCVENCQQEQFSLKQFSLNVLLVNIV